jgi:hypothetical protein
VGVTDTIWSLITWKREVARDDREQQARLVARYYGDPAVRPAFMLSSGDHTTVGPPVVRHELEFTNIGKASAGAIDVWLADEDGVPVSEPRRLPSLAPDGGMERFTLTEDVVEGVERDGYLVCSWSDLSGSYEERVLALTLHS